MSSKLKGVWIDGGVWECESLTLIEKHLIQKIKDLDNEKGCTAMNGWFSEFLGVSKSRVSQLVSSLKKKKFISIKLKYKGKEVVGRVVRILKGGMLLFKGGMLKINTPISYSDTPPLEYCEESNILLSNIVKEYKVKEEKYKKDISILKNRIKELESKTGKDKSKEETKANFIKETRAILNFFIATTGKQVRISKKDSILARSDKYKKIMPRLKEGATVEECKAVITLKSKQWKNDKAMNQHLCIPTLFRASNFEKYLDELGNKNNNPNGNGSFSFKSKLTNA